MALNLRQPSTAMRRALLSGGRLLKRGDPTPAQIASEGSGLPVYMLGLQQLVDGGMLQEAEMTNWRFLARGETGAPIAADVKERPGAAPVMTAVWRGPQIENVVQGSREVERHAEGDLRFELRVVRIPGLRLEAFWLRSPDGAADRVVPVISPVGRQLERMRSYSADEFLNIVRPLAKLQLDLENSDGPPPTTPPKPGDEPKAV